ncbi:MAG: HIT domain-containing protein [Bdellovibrionales bacterium]|nr:HIT domain-containing protein [Bdellovibrionales bacterium]
MDVVTIFEKIIKKEIPAEIVFENHNVLAFKDISPQASTHVLFIHKEKSTNINEMIEKNPTQISDIFKAIKEFTELEGIDQHGFRVVTNCGARAGQSVFYTHFHLLSGESFGNFGRA